MSSSSSSSLGIGFLDNKLPMRDLTGKYARFRNAYFINSSPAVTRSKGGASSLSGPLLPAGGASSGDLEEHPLGNTLRPEWAEIHEQVEADMRAVKESSQTHK